MKLLPLTKGKFAQVDDEDFNWLSQWKWLAQPKRRGGAKTNPIVNYYARRNVKVGINPETKQKKVEVINLARELVGISENKQLRVQHIDGDGLNCQKSNLRVATIPQIYYGKTGRKGKGKTKEKSIYMGVCVIKSSASKYVTKSGETKNYNYNNKYWEASIVYKGKQHHKTFPFTPEGEIQAAKWYDEMAIKLHEDFAHLNFPKKELGGNLTTFVYEIGGL